MSDSTWKAADKYISEQLIGEDEALDAALAASAEAGLPPIAVSPPQGKLLYLLARSIDARSVLEIGTLGGYSTIWLARAVTAGDGSGSVITLEADARYAEVARANIAKAGFAETVEVHVGAAFDSLDLLAADVTEPFDLVFIDADKVNTPAYFSWALQRTRSGGLIIADNVIRDGAIVDPEGGDPGGLAARRLHEMLSIEPRVSATTIQTVGLKGYDGFTLMLVN
ncbi:MAG TPA: O-methyltransferase [Solirubrobacteraceae bacterium]|nr:O-methyltransferase [Solirubrobacteraceae bacterium]